MARRSRPTGHGRRAARHHSGPAGPSVAEFVVYGLLGTVVATGLLVLNGSPRSVVAGVAAGALALIGTISLVATRIRPTRADDDPDRRRRRRAARRGDGRGLT